MSDTESIRRDLLAAERRVRELEQQLLGTLSHVLADGLTGLWNASYLEDHLLKELSRMKHSKLPLSILLQDVDGLRAVNDRFGRAAGDLLLKDIGALLRESARAADIVGRWGGDEFIVLLPEASKSEALALAKRLHVRLDEYRLQTHGEALAVSVSMGIVAYPVDGEQPEDMIRRAEAALQVAKQRGGNQISVYAGAVGGSRKRVGEYLMELGVCTVEQMEEAIRYCLEASQRGEYMAVGEALTKLGYATEKELERALHLQAQEHSSAK